MCVRLAVMAAPNMYSYLGTLKGRTVTTLAESKPNTIVDLTARRVLVRTEDGSENWVSIAPQQRLADRIFSGEEVQVETRGRSAFHAAVLATLPEVDSAIRPRRLWLRDDPASFDREYAELFTDEDTTALEGRMVYRLHRMRERSPVLRRLKIQQALAVHGRLGCEACGFDFAERYGALGEGFIECHHKTPLATGDERETTVDDLALVCSNCHRMLHRSREALNVDELRSRLAA
jgi:HNH endonuclease